MVLSAAGMALWAVLVWGGEGGPTAAAQEEEAFVRRAELEAEVGLEGSSAVVRVVYTLQVPAVTPLRFQMLGFGDADPSAVWLGDARHGTWMELDPRSGSLRAADYTLNLAAPDTAFRLEVRYRVPAALDTDGPRARARLPVLVVDLPPAPGGGEVFEARVRIPEGWRLLEGFPSGLRAAPPDSSGAVYASVTLPVLPSVVRLRARTDGVWRPGLPFVLDLVTVVTLLAFAGWGLRHLRRLPTR